MSAASTRSKWSSDTGPETLFGGKDASLFGRRQKRARGARVPVVVVTALDLTAEDRQRLDGGVKQVLSKSAFAPAELMARVGALLGETRKAQK